MYSGSPCAAIIAAVTPEGISQKVNELFTYAATFTNTSEICNDSSCLLQNTLDKSYRDLFLKV